MLLPLECLEKLKCSICNRLLSAFPVFINKNDQQLSVCGRCQLPDKDNYLRCEIYENIAKNIRFPCINKEYGCMLNVLPADIEIHEEVCCYRGEYCILGQQTNCEWKGPWNQLVVHYKNDHEELLLLNNQFEFNASEDYDLTNILPYWGEMFLLQCNFNQISKQLKCSISPLILNTSSAEYYAQLDLTTNITTITQRFPKMGARERQSQSIDINIESALSNDVTKITGTILIVHEEEKFDYNTKLNQEHLKKMKCFKCNEVIITWIYNCGGTHYVCGNCRNSDAICDLAATKVFALVYQRCPYGCNFIGANFNIHYCLYQPIECPLNTRCCKWSGIEVDAVKHLQNSHGDKVLKLNEIVRLDIHKGPTEYYFHYIVLYKLTITNDLEKVSFVTNCLLRTHYIGDFRFVIDIFDNNGNERIRIGLHHSSSKGFNYELFQYQMKDIIFENTLTFRLSVLNSFS